MQKMLWGLAACLCSLAAWAGYDPLAFAREQGRKGSFYNREAAVPPQCYTRTDGRANPCWVCHVPAQGRNFANDLPLQFSYAFSDAALQNHWQSLFWDLSAHTAKISVAEVGRYIATDNYSPLRTAMAAQTGFPGYLPDVDYHQGFDQDGFARDGSGWRAFRYKPFPGTFWPTNGATDDVLIRLPAAFRQAADGSNSMSVYRQNLGLLEKAMTTPATQLAELPKHYLGAAHNVVVVQGSYPLGTEFLHSVRYVDVTAANGMARRMKELRYSVKRLDMTSQQLLSAYDDERWEKNLTRLPFARGSAETGLMNAYGWQYQGFIEDQQGRLRLQSDEEQAHCLGCHGTLGVTVDSSFAFPRKLPGAKGWAWQSLVGMPDAPQHGHDAPETLRYFERNQGADEFRENTEMLQRFWHKDQLRTAQVLRASAGGDKDLHWLLMPSRQRALALNRSSMAMARSQPASGYAHGRYAGLRPAKRVWRNIQNGDTGLAENRKVFQDGTLWLDWPGE